MSLISRFFAIPKVLTKTRSGFFVNGSSLLRGKRDYIRKSRFLGWLVQVFRICMHSGCRTLNSWGQQLTQTGGKEICKHLLTFIFNIINIFLQILTAEG